MRLLLVEDEDAVRRVLERILTPHGYQVLVAPHPRPSTCDRGEGTPIDMLITDVVMPGMSGPQLAARLTELQPGLPVVFVSGYTDRPDELPPGPACSGSHSPTRRSCARSPRHAERS